MKPKAKTYLERLGFNNSELTTPEHDKLCIQFAQNHKQILAPHLPKIELKIKQKKSENISTCPICNKTITKIINKQEYNPSTYSTQTIQQKYFICKENHAPYINSQCEWEKPIFAQNGFLIGFIDFKIQFTHEKILNDKPLNFFIEVKPQIKSIGETLRQINTYKAYMPNSKPVIVTHEKDKQITQILQSQGIIVITI